MRSSNLTRVLADAHPEYRIGSLSQDNCRERAVRGRLRDILPRNDSSFQILLSGVSTEGRRLPLIRFGSGPIRLLLWSQMHGDESTATLALMDMLSFFARGGLAKAGMGSLAERCSLYMIPILNPDGAEVQTRHTAAGIDMNRDARRCVTPEARFLRNVHRIIHPSFGFNLHDQELSTVGNSSNLTAIALLAPAAEERRRVSASRKRAMQVASVMASSLKPLAEGRIGSYNDAFEPRAFGDMMQSWGTSTVLVESGHWVNDPGKEKIRLLNFVGLLSAIESIASGSFRKAGLKAYSDLQENGKRAYGVVVRGATVVHGPSFRIKADIGFQLERLKGRVIARIREVGDLRDFGAMLSIKGGKVIVNSSKVRIGDAVQINKLNKMLGTNLAW